MNGADGLRGGFGSAASRGGGCGGLAGGTRGPSGRGLSAQHALGEGVAGGLPAAGTGRGGANGGGLRLGQVEIIRLGTRGGAVAQPADQPGHPARGGLAQQYGQQRGDEAPGDAQIAVQRPRQQRPDGAAAVGVAIGLGHEVGQDLDAHVPLEDHPLDEEDVHGGEDQQQRGHVGQRPQHGHPPAAGCRYAQHPRPGQRHRQQPDQVAAQAAHHVPDRPHQRALLGLGERYVHQEHRQAEQRDGCQARQRSVRRPPVLILSLFNALNRHGYLLVSGNREKGTGNRGYGTIYDRRSLRRVNPSTEKDGMPSLPEAHCLMTNASL